MTYQDLTQQDYVNLRNHSINITTWLRELIEINDKQDGEFLQFYGKLGRNKKKYVEFIIRG